MDPISLSIAISNLICGLFMVGLGIPLARGQIGRNSLYGFRFAKSFTSDENWLRINRYGGWRMLGWSPALFLAAMVALAVPLSERPRWALALMLAPCVILVPCIQAYRFAQKLS